MDIRPVELAGTRAKLVPLSVDHIPALLDAAQYPEIWEWFPYCPMTLETMTEFVEMMLRQGAAGQSLAFTIIDLHDGSIVGNTRFAPISHEHRNAEIGTTWLTPRVWRTRINTECKYLLMRYAFETWHLLRLQLKTDVGNIRSQRAIERLGGVREGVWRRHLILQSGRLRDSVMYSILDDEWPAVKAALEAKLA